MSLQSQLQTLFSGGTGGSTVFARLSDLGVELQKDGTLKVNDAKLSNALSNPGEVAKAFSNSAPLQPANDGLARRVKLLAGKVLGSDGLVSTRSQGLRDSIASNDKQITRYEGRVAATEKRLLRQYGALDASLSQIKSLSNFVTQQIGALNNNNNKN